ncbi:hypothetical protein [Halomontanus rarus]|uniref:hypothetical protein n=1 Tax=Halomontanus rarus TaxID=3034020 RepID=UPI001A994015
MHSVMGMIHVVGLLYGLETTRFGWAFHLLHAVVFAVIFGLFFLSTHLEEFRYRVLACTTIGIVWGTVLWLGAAD